MEVFYVPDFMSRVLRRWAAAEAAAAALTPKIVQTQEGVPFSVVRSQEDGGQRAKARREFRRGRIVLRRPASMLPAQRSPVLRRPPARAIERVDALTSSDISRAEQVTMLGFSSAGAAMVRSL